MQALKKNIRMWNSKIKDSRAALKSNILKKLSEIDQGFAEPADIVTRVTLVKESVKTGQIEAADVAQKA